MNKDTESVTKKGSNIPTQSSTPKMPIVKTSTEDEPRGALFGWFELECELHSNKQIPKEERMIMAYGALNSARLAGEITWNEQHEKFGDFVASLYGIKIWKK